MVQFVQICRHSSGEPIQPRRKLESKSSSFVEDFKLCGIVNLR